MGKSNGQVDSAITKPSDFRVAYNSSLIYPGAALGIDFPVQYIEVIKHRNDGHSKTILKQRFISGTLGFYHHKGFHDNIYILPEWVMRRSKGEHWYSEFNFGLGYSRIFLGGTTYKVDGNGNVSIIPLAGFSYAVAAAGFGMGYNLIARNIPFSIYSRFNMLAMFPYNSTIYPRPALEIGIVYSPAHFLIRQLHVVQKGKNKE
jgi:hypothetical protein